jgi:hypothetical protein
MRLLIPNIITPEEAKNILRWPPKKHNRSKDIPAVLKIREVIESTVGEIDWSKPTRIEVIPESHAYLPWHVDTGGAYGSEGHMAWCDYGCSLLLNDKDTSGYLEYRDSKVLSKEHFCSLALHSSDIEHRVINDGTREVILFFVQRKL